MRSANHKLRPMGFRKVWDEATTRVRIAAIVLAFLVGTPAHADPIQDANIAEAENCNNTGLCAYGSRPATPAVDPCYLAQNAMRPCVSGQPQPPKPIGVDPKTVGTWELPLKGGLWVWEIHRDGTYRFHSEAGDGAPPHAGTFSASNGQWTLKATTGYADSGTYVWQAPDTLIATGQLGTAAWRQHAPKPVSSQLAQ
jgi:hypothetical protein